MSGMTTECPQPHAEADDATPPRRHRDRLWRLGELAASISHDVSQPLNVMRLTAESTLEMLSDDNFDPEWVRKTLRTVVAQTMRTREIIDGLTAVTRRPMAPPARLSAVEVVRVALSGCLTLFKRHRVRLRWHADLASPPVTGHAHRLEAAVRHLLINACEAISTRRLDQDADQMRQTGNIEVECRPEGSGLAISVSDDGCGFPPALHAALAGGEPAPSGLGKGCGLGLTVILGVAEEMGGRLSIDGTPSGTRITLHLPAAERSLLLTGASPAELASPLAALGWSVHVAGNDDSALCWLQENGADAVLADGGDLRLLRTLHHHAPSVPIVAVTDGTDDLRLPAIEAGATLVLSTPVGVADLADELRELLSYQF
ncbi:MAG TPA: ATP-binding protein [Magnetospirillum sp.]|nr:ATP-binding protein [Magnetospirillum sp.]